MESASEDYDVVFVVLVRAGGEIIQAKAQRLVAPQDRSERTRIEDMPVRIAPDSRGFELDNVAATIARDLVELFLAQEEADLEPRHDEEVPGAQ